MLRKDFSFRRAAGVGSPVKCIFMRAHIIQLSLTLFALLAMCSAASADVFDDAVVRVTFAGDSIDDQNYADGNQSIATIAGPEAGTKALDFVDVADMPNGNGRGIKFLDDQLLLSYGLGAGDELKLDGTQPFTYHARLQFISRNGEHWIMGRFASSDRVSYLTDFHQDGAVENLYGAFSTTGTNSVSTQVDGVPDYGPFYDVFLRFVPGQSITLTVWETGGDMFGQAATTTGYSTLNDAPTPFEVAGRTNGGTGENYLDSTIEQFNVWNKALSNDDLYYISHGRYPSKAPIFDEAVVSVTFAGDSIDDQSFDDGNQSIGTVAGPEAGTKALDFVNVADMPNGNGRGIKFLDDELLLSYGLGAGDELKLDGTQPFTYHARLQFISRSGEHWIMGRFTSSDRVSYLTDFHQDGAVEDVLGAISTTGTNAKSAQVSSIPDYGPFYDVFLRFIPGQSVKVTVWETGGTLFGETITATGYDTLWDAVTPFEVAGRTNGTDGQNYLDSTIEQFNVWDRALTDDEVYFISHGTLPDKGADFNRDKAVDLLDFGYLAGWWLSSTDPADAGNADAISRAAAEAASLRWSDWLADRDEFPTAAWSYFQRYDGTEAEYTTYKEANLTMVEAPLGTEPNAAAVGLGTITGLWSDDDKKEDLHLHLDKLADYVANAGDAVIGYMITDEPRTMWEMQQLGYANNYVYMNDKRNALPMATYSADPYSIAAYAEIANPAVILTTTYALMADGNTDVDKFYSNCEAAREVALDRNIGMMGFALVTAHGDYREASESDVYWQVYSLVAYGSKGIWYYNYRITDSGYGEGLVTSSDGAPYTTYYYAQSVDNELHNLWPALKPLRSVGVFHTGTPLPEGTTAYTNGSVTGITALTADKFVVAEFQNQDTPSDTDVYIMFVNKRNGAGRDVDDPTLQASLQFTVDSAYPYVYMYDNTTGDLQQLSAPYSLDFGGGQGVLIRLSSDPES